MIFLVAFSMLRGGIGDEQVFNTNLYYDYCQREGEIERRIIIEESF